MKPDNRFWIPRANPEAPWRLVCFPYAGGGPTLYRLWHQFVPATFEVCAVTLAGRGLRRGERPHPSVSQIIDDLLSGLEEIADRKLVFFGHSFGGWLAYEAAKAMEAAGLRGPSHFFASASMAPHLHRPDPQAADVDDDHLVAQMETWSATPREILESRELMRMVLPVMRADHAAYCRYECKHDTPLEADITAFAATRDTLVSEDEVDGWRQHTTGTFDLVAMPGDHFFITTRQRVFATVFAAELSWIASARGGVEPVGEDSRAR